MGPSSPILSAKGKRWRLLMWIQQKAHWVNQIISHLNRLFAKKTHIYPPFAAYLCWLCNATLPSMEKSYSPLTVYLASRCRLCASRRSRLSSGGNSSQQTARPVAFAAQWSPGSSLDLWCKSFYYLLRYALTQSGIIINCGSWLLRVFEPLIVSDARYKPPQFV